MTPLSPTTNKSLFSRSWKTFNCFFRNTHDILTRVFLEVWNILRQLAKYLIFQLTLGKVVTSVNSGDGAGHEIGPVVLIHTLKACGLSIVWPGSRGAEKHHPVKNSWRSGSWQALEEECTETSFSICHQQQSCQEIWPHYHSFWDRAWDH